MKKVIALLIIGILALCGFDFTSANLSSVAEAYDLIIITPELFSTELQPLVEHKEQHGIVTKIVTLDELYNGDYFEVEGRDKQEIIKYFIKNAKDAWNITYVLLVGNPRHLPIRYCYNYDGYGSLEKCFISDLYYSDTHDENGSFSSWDTNNNSIYGEWDGEEAQDKYINLTPEVCLGRLACKNSGEVKIVVNKIINYEKQPADPSWFKRFGVCGGDTYQEYPGYEGEIYNQMAIDIMNDFTEVKLWASNGYLAEKGWSILHLINQGCGFLYLSGHGSPKTWVTKTSDEVWTGDFNQFMMFFLNNRNRLPVCLVGGCHNSQFDTNLLNLLKNPIEAWFHSTWLPECWSWQLTSKRNGGAIATIGTTGLCWYSCEFDGGGTDWLNLQFFREYQNEEKIIGKIWKNAITLYLNEYPISWETPSGSNSSLRAKTVQEWILLGDPTLKVGGYP